MGLRDKYSYAIQTAKNLRMQGSADERDGKKTAADQYEGGRLGDGGCVQRNVIQQRPGCTGRVAGERQSSAGRRRHAEVDREHIKIARVLGKRLRKERA